MRKKEIQKSRKLLRKHYLQEQVQVRIFWLLSLTKLDKVNANKCLAHNKDF